MFRITKLFSFGLVLMMAVGAFAQDVQIQFPQEGQLVRGQVTVRYSGIPDGGYAVVKIDNVFTSATAQNTFVLNTFPPTFAKDGKHTITVIGMNAGGKSAGEKTVTFEVANNKMETGGESVLLTHYVDAMRLESNVQRYRLFAESNATMEGGSGGAASGGEGAAGGGGMGADSIKAPLDWQVSALMRRIVRDVGMYSDRKAEGGSSANIRTVVQEAYQHQRIGEGGGDKDGGAGGGASAGKPRRSRKKKGPPAKAPWKPDWEAAPEIGQYFVKMIEPSGKEINATRKAPTIALADLLPTFPETPVRPGSTWETRMTFLGDLSSRQPINVSVPITFTSFENVQTVNGTNRRAAKLESRFQVPIDLAKKMAVNLVLQGAGSGGAGGAGGAESGAGAAGGDGAKAAAKTWNTLPADELQDYLDSITTVRTSASRVLWFDIENHRVIRSEDTINTYFEYESAEGGEGMTGGGAAPRTGTAGRTGAGGGAGEEEEAGPQKITYDLVVTTWLDDKAPAPSPSYTGGGGTAHSRDNVTDPTTERMIKP